MLSAVLLPFLPFFGLSATPPLRFILDVRAETKQNGQPPSPTAPTSPPPSQGAEVIFLHG